MGRRLWSALLFLGLTGLPLRPRIDAAILAKLDNIPLRTPSPFTKPEQSASSRIEYPLDRLPILLETQRTTYPMSVCS